MTLMDRTENRNVMTGVALTARPEEVLVDEKFDVQVSGLRPGQKVTIYATVVESGMTFGACGCFLADQSGKVTVSSDQSLSGTYTGVAQMGLIWSLRQCPGQRSGLRLCKKDVTTPQEVKLAVYNEHCLFEDFYNCDRSPLACTKVFRWYKGKEVTRVPVHEGRVRGTLFIPSGEGPFPGIIDMFGAGGGLMEYRASLLATRGFAVLALAFQDYMDLPKATDILELNYFKEAVQILQDHPNVESGGIGIIAVSKGAEVAQLLTLHCPLVKALVTINGHPFLTHFPIKNGDDTIPVGKTIDPADFVYTEEGIIMKYAHFNKPNYIFELWKTDAKVLSVSSGDDECVHPHLHRLQYDKYPQDKKDNIELLEYKGAGHLLEPPFSPFCRSSYHKIAGMVVLWGGRPVDHAFAQEDSWTKIINFFNTNLSNMSKKPQLPRNI